MGFSETPAVHLYYFYSGSSGWRAWKSLRSRRRLNSCRPTARKSGRDRRSPWTSRYRSRPRDSRYVKQFLMTDLVMRKKMNNFRFVWQPSKLPPLCPLGPLPQSVWAEAELFWPRRHQMGTIHWSIGPLWDEMLKLKNRTGPCHVVGPAVLDVAHYYLDMQKKWSSSINGRLAK